MAEVPVVRNRKNEIAERKMECPFCGVNNLTYRKVVKHYSIAHQEEMRVVGIKCKAEGCHYMCNKGIKCFKDHLKNVHANNKNISYKLCRVKITPTNHSKRCNLITDKFMVEKLTKFSDALDRKKAKEMKKEKISLKKMRILFEKLSKGRARKAGF